MDVGAGNDDDDGLILSFSSYSASDNILSLADRVQMQIFQTRLSKKLASHQAHWTRQCFENTTDRIEVLETEKEA